METSVQIFGVSAAGARLTGRILSWFWLMAGITYGITERHTLLSSVSLIYNFLHYYPEIGDFLSDFIGYENTIDQPLKSMDTLFGTVAFAYF